MNWLSPVLLWVGGFFIGYAVKGLIEVKRR